MSARRPCPPDFAEKSAALGYNQLMAHYRCGVTTMQRWQSEAAGRVFSISDPLRPIPTDFHQHAREANRDLMKRYSCGTRVLARWRAAIGVKVTSSQEPQPLPDGFRLVAPTMTVKELRHRYRRSDRIIRRWLQEAGVDCRRAARVQAKASTSQPVLRFSSLPQKSYKEDSRAGRAADFLRRLGPVYRCDAQGHQMQDGPFWNRNGFILTDEDIVQRAVRNGWKPDAWRHAA